MMQQEWPIVIAVDFDGTLCESEWPRIGAPRDAVLHRMARAQDEGAEIVLYTMREGVLLLAAEEFVRRWMQKNGYTGFCFAAINDNTAKNVERFGATPRKVYADEYWDDHNVFVEGVNDGGREAKADD